MELRDRIYQALDARQFALAREAIAELRAEAPAEAAGLLTALEIEAGRLDKAAVSLEELRQLSPQDIYTRFLEARLAFSLHAYQKARHILEELLAVDMSGVYLEKVLNLYGQCCRLFGNRKGAAESYRLASKVVPLRELKALEYSDYLFNLHYLPQSLLEQKQAASGFGRIFSDVPTFLHGSPVREKKLRIGYLSGDFRNHVVLRFVYAFFSQVDKERFAVYAYANNSEDEYSEHLKTLVDGWRNIYGISDDEAARMIYEDEIDILVDFSGHTKGNRLPVLARKPAPVQLSGIGYFASTGLPAVDYFLSDVFLAEGNAQDGFTEELLVLPQSHFCYTPLQEEKLPQAAPFEKNGYITFGSFNNFAKVNDEVLQVWGRLLQELPTARLLLKADAFAFEDTKAKALERLMQAGLDMCRVECRAWSEEYLAEYGDMDIALDPWPYPGGGTTCDALYMGVPVVTMTGASQGERFGTSILQNLGLAELAAADSAEYVSIALSLAEDRDALSMLRKNLRSMMQNSPLMDTAGYQENLTAAYQMVWHHYCDTQEELTYADQRRLLARVEKWQAQGDRRQAASGMSRILAGFPSLSLLFRLAEIAIDGKETSIVEETARQMEQCGPRQGATFLVQAYLCSMKHETEKALLFSERARNAGTLDNVQMGMAWHLTATLQKEQGNRNLAARSYLESSRWQAAKENALTEYSNYLLNLHYGREREIVRSAAEGYGALLADVERYSHDMARHRHERLRIGYISPDFCRHVAACFASVFFTSADPLVFSVYAYSLTLETDAVTEEFRSRAEHFIDLSGMGAEEAARRIYEDEIDILVDLSGHTGGNALPILARKPAPVQVSGIGYFATTGLSAVDYFLSDVSLAEAGAQHDFVERLLVLPQSHWCYRPVAGMERPAGPAPFRKNGYITFGSLSHWDKITDEILMAWAEILNRVQGARLFLKCGVYSNEERLAEVKRRLQEAGIPLKNVVLEGRTEEYLSAYGRIDIALDTWPYLGGGTTCDALYMGVPVIARKDGSHHGRFACSMLKQAGIAELCAGTSEEYIREAVLLAGNREKLARLHQTLRRTLQQTALMDGERYMAGLEDAYRTIWRRYCEENGSPLDVGRLQKEFLAARQEGHAEKEQRSSFWLTNLPERQLEAERVCAFSYYKRKLYRRAYGLASRCVRLDAGDEAMLYVAMDSLDKLGELSKVLERCDTYFRTHVSPYSEYGKKLLLLRAYAASKLGRESAAQYYREVYENDPSDTDAYGSWLLAHNGFPVDEGRFFELSKGFGRLFEGIQPYTHEGHLVHEKLRIGYISPDFRIHVMFHFYIAMFLAYDAEKFEIYGYHLGGKTDEITKRLAGLAKGWRMVHGCSPKEIAQMIRDDEIDILFDLAGHTMEGGLPVLACKPAPVQISGLGYMATTGLPAVDYFLTDSYVDPVGMAERYFTERLLRLTSQFCYAAPFGTALEASQGAPCRQRGWVLFGVFNAYRKYRDEMLLLWKKILERVAGSKILLKSQVLFSPAMQEEAFERFASLGFDMDRVIFEPATTDYMQRYLDVDISLDTYPYPGGGTTCDSLYMGVPVIAKYGTRHSSRFTYSILANVGLGSLAVQTDEEYVERAVLLAEDKELLDALHRKLRRMMERSSVMDTDAYMRELEAAYQRIWKEYQEGAGSRA